MSLYLKCLTLAASFLTVLCSLSQVLENINISSISFVILSQPNKYHEQLAEMKQEYILQQFLALGFSNEPKIFIAPKNFNITGYWTVFPIIEKLASNKEWTWVFLCEEQTHINISSLIQLLSTYNSIEDYFLGYSLKDSQPTIVHHFDSNNIDYPDFSAGFLMSFNLVKKISHRWQSFDEPGFSIDAKYELAKFIWNGGSGTKLKHETNFCLTRNEGSCITWIGESFPECAGPVSNAMLYFAVKTCHKYFERVQVVKETWGKDASFIAFFTDSNNSSDNSSFPAVNLGIKNVPHGHCEKTLAIMNYVNKKYPSVSWLVIADDDTLLSVLRLRKLLSCYNSSEAIALGERYGYGLATDYGYDYITGGGGMVFSMLAVKQILLNCICPSPDSPDDMILGLCLKHAGIPIIHSPYFHQARPDDYSSHFLSHHHHISFHKHWMIDPYEVYETWLSETELPPSQHRVEL